MALEISDSKLVLEAQKGSLTAFENLVARYESKLIQFVLRYQLAREDAEDMVQDTFIAVYKNLVTIDRDKPFSTYIFEIAKNKTISFLRKHQRKVELLDTHLVDEETGWFERLTQESEKEKLRALLHKLPQAQAQVIQLYYFEEYDYINISKKLAKPVNTIKTLMRRAKIRLKEELT